jgi:hypothetical protein
MGHQYQIELKCCGMNVAVLYERMKIDATGGIMLFSETCKKEHSQLLTGRFKSQKDVYQAQEVLTDFGYPKESTNVIDLTEKTNNAVTPGQPVENKIIARIIEGIIIVAALSTLLIAAELSYLSLKAVFTLSEIVVIFVLWVLIISIGILFCCFVGGLLWTLVNYAAIKRVVNDEGEFVRPGRVLISVMARTPNDARDIAREWKDIGGELVT